MDQARDDGAAPPEASFGPPRAAPQPAAFPSQTVTEIAVAGAPWLRTPRLALDPGLIAIIGARGSGKTALAEMIASGCNAVPPGVNPRSFLHRARAYLAGVTVTLAWAAGDSATRALASETRDEANFGTHAGGRGTGLAAGPRARYLSQQFVEDLCASDGITSGLLREIERIVFESHDVTARDGALDFHELVTRRAARPRETRAREEAALALLSERISAERQKQAQISALHAQIAEKTALAARLVADRDTLAAPGSAGRIARLTELTQAAERVRAFVRYFTLQEQQLRALKDEVAAFRARDAPEALRALQRKYAASGLKGEMWAPFLLDYAGPVERVLDAEIARAQRSSASWRGRPPLPSGPEVELIHPAMDPVKVPLAVLEAEIARLGRRVSLDRDSAERFTALSRRIAAETDLLTGLKERLEDAEGAEARVRDLEAERTATLVRIFAAIADEQQVLVDLYAPIAERLRGASGSLAKLSFAVKRTADFKSWLAEGEALLDTRRGGPFAAPGALFAAAAPLRDAWETGTPEGAAAAVAAFRAAHEAAFAAHAPSSDASSPDAPRGDTAGEGSAHRAWMQRLNAWLAGTGHIAVRYAVEYDGVDIRHLSPGTRGIVLLLLYLGFDQDDDRPLIIDQPEENLDPKSVYDELVGLFVAAKRRRQVVLVTHNANLVVNTGADQVIVASIGSNPGTGLPPITYRSGRLDDADTRQAVCDILEGGAAAFRERARRLGLD